MVIWTWVENVTDISLCNFQTLGFLKSFAYANNMQLNNLFQDDDDELTWVMSQITSQIDP